MLYSCYSPTNRSKVSLYKDRSVSVTPMAILAAVALTIAGISQAALAQVPNADFFPIGVHGQPKSSFDKWQSRGINTLFQYEGENNAQGVPTVTMQQWSAAAAAKGLYYVRAPSANPADDLQEKYLIAWAQKDEPDLSNHSPNPATNIDIYQNWKAIAPSKPVWINFAGPNITVGGANYTQWDKAGDWIASDWYPVNWARYNNLNFVGKATEKLKADAGGVPKKYFSYIETSWQKLAGSTRGPTKDEFRGEVWSAIIHGASGIIYFPQVVPDKTIGGSFSYDGTPADVAAEMTTQDAIIQSFGRQLNTTFNPSSRSVTASSTSIESTWRVTQDGDYFFVLNQSPNTLTNVTLNLTGLAQSVSSLAVAGENRTELVSGASIVDNFTPYQVHIYETAAATGAGVPEPTGLGILATATCAWGLKRRQRSRKRSDT
jgi:hypothetical protein